MSMVRCSNCFGTGTVFPTKGPNAKSKKCPVCKGKCKVPAVPPTTLHGAQRSAS